MTGLDYFKDKRIDELTNHLNILSDENLKLIEKLKDFENHGLRADLNPTQPIDDWMEVTRFFLDYLKRIDSSVRDRAKL